jgi:hypothetical protein
MDQVTQPNGVNNVAAADQRNHSSSANRGVDNTVQDDQDDQATPQTSMQHKLVEIILTSVFTLAIGATGIYAMCVPSGWVDEISTVCTNAVLESTSGMSNTQLVQLCNQTHEQQGQLEDLARVIMKQHVAHSDSVDFGFQLVAGVLFGILFGYLWHLTLKQPGDKVLPTWAVLLCLSVNACLASVGAPSLKALPITAFVTTSDSFVRYYSHNFTQDQEQYHESTLKKWSASCNPTDTDTVDEVVYSCAFTTTS